MTFAFEGVERERWQRIAAHALGGDDARFAARVARVNGWTEAETRDAVEEYRRFVALACRGREEATPSKAVDAVWHEHLLHTRDYWDVFCPQVLGMPLHHAPGTGAASDEARFAAQYERTRVAYREWFGEPPARWWPQRGDARDMRIADGAQHARGGQRIADGVPHARDALRRIRAAFAPGPGERAIAFAAALALLPALAFVAALALLPALALAAARPTNPFDWMGPDFLALYFVLMVVTMFATPLWRGWLRSRGADVGGGHTLTPLETAYLAGGAPRTVDAGVATLHHRGVLRWDREQRRFERDGSADGLESPLRELAGVFAGTGIGKAAKLGNVAVQPVRRALEQRGLYESQEEARRIARLSALPAFVLLLFGLAKIAIGVARDRPVAVLVALSVLVAIYTVVNFAGSAKPTRAGRAALKHAQSQHRAARNRFDDIGLAVALGGTAILSGTALAGYHDVRAPRSDGSGDSSSSSSDSSSDSGGGGGSSCGGCGGGGGGD